MSTIFLSTDRDRQLWGWGRGTACNWLWQWHTTGDSKNKPQNIFIGEHNPASYKINKFYMWAVSQTTPYTTPEHPKDSFCPRMCKIRDCNSYRHLRSHLLSHQTIWEYWWTSLCLKYHWSAVNNRTKKNIFSLLDESQRWSFIQTCYICALAPVVHCCWASVSLSF